MAAVGAAGEASGGGHGAVLLTTRLLHRDKHTGVLDDTQVRVSISLWSRDSGEVMAGERKAQ